VFLYFNFRRIRIINRLYVTFSSEFKYAVLLLVLMSVLINAIMVGTLSGRSWHPSAIHEQDAS